jgi:hypothetical protein
LAEYYSSHKNQNNQPTDFHQALSHQAPSSLRRLLPARRKTRRDRSSGTSQGQVSKKVITIQDDTSERHDLVAPASSRSFSCSVSMYNRTTRKGASAFQPVGRSEREFSDGLILAEASADFGDPSA